MMRILAIIATLALTVGPALAQQAARGPAEEKVLQGVIMLPHERQLEVMKRLGVKPEGGFLNCLCAQAGYGSSSTQQFYHPDTIGEYNKAYSCSQPGAPCVVSGFGCMRYPLPSDGKIWERCATANRPEGGKTVLDSILAGAAGRGGARAADVRKALADCRANWENQVDTRSVLAPYDGFDYLSARGVPVLPPPPKLAAKMKSEAELAQAKIVERLREKEKVAEEQLQDSLTSQVAASIFKNKDNHIAAATLARELTELEAGDVRREIEKLTAQQKNLKIPAGQEKTWTYTSIQSEIDGKKARMAQYERDQKHLKEFILAVDAAQDIKDLSEHYENATGGDPRKAAGAIHGTGEIVQKYLDLYREHRDELAGELADAAATEGLTDAQQKLFQSMTTQNEVMKGASQAMGETLKAGSWAMKTWDGYQSFKQSLAEAERMNDAGNYTAAQARMLQAFTTMSKLSEAASGYLPPGISDLVGFYGEAMKTPAAMDAILREAVNRSEEHAEVTGDQANTPAMRAYQDAHPGTSLQREDYLYRKAGLQAYRMDNDASDKPYVLIPKADGAPIYLSAANYEKLMQMAYYYPIAEGRRMTDADVLRMLGTMGDKGTVNVEDMRRKADAALKSAAGDQKIADRFGQKTISNDDAKMWTEFERLMSDSLPARCALDAKTQKRLFGSFLESERGAVTTYLSDLGARLKAAELSPAAGK
jgi:hypothetical protein